MEKKVVAVTKPKPYVLGIDPSGSFNEGKGITGFALLDSDGKLDSHAFILARDYETQLHYWGAVLDTIELFRNDYNLVLSIEDYVLYASSAKSQINSELETSKLIGAILMDAYKNDLKTYIRNSSQVKNRWNNKILEHKGFITKERDKWVDQYGHWVNKHCLDALRHALHCHYFELGKEIS